MKGSIVEPNDDPTSHGVETVIVNGENGDFKVIPKSEYDETKDYFEKDPELNYYFEMPEDLDYCTSNEESEMTVFEGKEIDTIMVAPYELDDDGVVNGYFDFSDI